MTEQNLKLDVTEFICVAEIDKITRKFRRHASVMMMSLSLHSAFGFFSARVLRGRACEMPQIKARLSIQLAQQ